jgi:hypothetical protein
MLPVSCSTAVTNIGSGAPPSTQRPFPDQDQAGPRQVSSNLSTLTVPVDTSPTITPRALKRSPEAFVRMSVCLYLKTCERSPRVLGGGIAGDALARASLVESVDDFHSLDADDATPASLCCLAPLLLCPLLARLHCLAAVPDRQ